MYGAISRMYGAISRMYGAIKTCKPALQADVEDFKKANKINKINWQNGSR